MIADPAADIGDIFAWTSADGRRLNLVMDIVAHRFSDRLQYVFHVDNGRQFGTTTATTTIVCRFDVRNAVECWAGDADYVRGDAGAAAGLPGTRGRMRVFAGLRADPFFNNVKGTRAIYQLAGSAIRQGITVDRSGCPQFDETRSRAILDAWRHTDGGPATNFLSGWKSSSLVVSIDLGVVATAGDLLAVWGAVHKVPRSQASATTHAAGPIPAQPTLGLQIERTARPLIKNALVGGPLSPDAESDRRKEAYNRVSRRDWNRFSADIAKTLGLYDGFDGHCGNQWLVDRTAAPPARYQPLARLLADDRIWVNSAATTCTRFLAVELAALGSPDGSSTDCGGRTPNYDASNTFRSLLTNGTSSGVDDGLHADEERHSTATFPFLAAP